MPELEEGSAAGVVMQECMANDVALIPMRGRVRMKGAAEMVKALDPYVRQHYAEIKILLQAFARAKRPVRFTGWH